MFQTIFAAILGGLLIGIGVALIIDFLLKKSDAKRKFFWDMEDFINKPIRIFDGEILYVRKKPKDKHKKTLTERFTTLFVTLLNGYDFSCFCEIILSTNVLVEIRCADGSSIWMNKKNPIKIVGNIYGVFWNDKVNSKRKEDFIERVKEEYSKSKTEIKPTQSDLLFDYILKAVDKNNQIIEEKKKEE